MGGLPAGKVEPTEHDYAAWERRIDALSVLLGTKRPNYTWTSGAKRSSRCRPTPTTR